MSEEKEYSATLKFTSVGVVIETPTLPPGMPVPMHIKYAEGIGRWAGTKEAVKIIGEFVGRRAAEENKEDW